jgi:phytoene synthase
MSTRSVVSGPLRNGTLPTPWVSRNSCRQPRLYSLRAVSEDEAAALAEQTTRVYAKSFYIASNFLKSSQKLKAFALYAWCREVDQIVDSSTDSRDARVALDATADRLGALVRAVEGSADYYADVALRSAFSKEIERGEFDVQPFEDMIAGMRQDLDEDFRFATFSDVELYAYRVAGTVALMMLPVILCDEDEVDAATNQLRRDRGVALGIALQLTNIIRDVGEDARLRKRVYMCEEDLAAFNLTREDVLSMKTPTDSYRAMIEFQIKRALGYYDEASKGLELLPLSSRPAVAIIAGLYKKILLSVRDNNYDNLNRRAFASTWEKVAALPGLIIEALVAK